jgi:hypothetical protein
VIRTAIIAAFVLGAASPALAFETHSVPAPGADAPHFVNGAKILGMMPAVVSEPFRFGPSDQAQTKGATVIYELKGGKPADTIDVTDPRDNPFMFQPERSAKRSPDAAH